MSLADVVSYFKFPLRTRYGTGVLPLSHFSHVVVCSVFSFSRIHFSTVSTVIPRLLFKDSLSFVLVESLSVVSVMPLLLADIISGHVSNQPEMFISIRKMSDV